MQSVGKMVSSQPTASRTFGELFGEAKGKLDSLQQTLGSFLPSMPGMPVGKFLDLSLGVDLHPTALPPSPVFPVPHIGMVFDIMAAIVSAIASLIPPPPAGDGPLSIVDMAGQLVKGMAPSVKIHGQWVANAGISVMHLPGVILHALPTVTPMSESEMWMGSSTVLADGSPCSTQFHPALSCNIVGFPSIFRKNKKPKPKISLMAPTSLLLNITSAGKPVLVGGPPIIDLFQLCIKLGLKGLGKLWKKVGDKLQKFIDNVKNPKLKAILQRSKCRLFGEPVDAATGRVYTNNMDFELPGPIPFRWERTYYSDAEIDGPLGYNWHHSYNMGLYDMESSFTLRMSDGRETALPKLQTGESYFDRVEQFTWMRDETGYRLKDGSGLYYKFEGNQNRDGYSMLSEISTADGFRIRFKYNNRGELMEIIDSRGLKLLVDSDLQGHITRVCYYKEDERIDLVRYFYDEAGNMVETKDALDVSKYFEYQGHLLTRLTNQSGMSFHWEYEGDGDESRCVHTWGDGGVLEYWIEYGEGVTRSRNSLGHETTYYYDDRKLIYKITDANGGTTHQLYNEYEELEVVVNPEGLSTKSIYNDHGKLIRQINENGESVHYTYDSHDNLTRIQTPGGMTLTWEYDPEDRITKRTTAGGDELTYSYEDGLLKHITDRQERVFTLEYNKYNDIARLIYPNGLERQWIYDRDGRISKSIDVKGNRTAYTYDKAGNLIRLDEADGNIHHFAYDASGNLTGAKDKIHEVTFTYGPMGVLTGRRQNERLVSFEYDNELQLRTILNEGEEKYAFELDGLGQVVAETGFDGLRREYIRDGAGRVRKVLRPGGKWTAYEYNGTGNVVKEEQYDGLVSAYRYNPDGLLIEAINEEGLLELKRDKAGRIFSESQAGHTITRTYNKQGECIRITSSLGADIELSHDPDGNLQKIETADWQASWKRDQAGLEFYRELTGNVTIRTERDRFGREVHKSVGVRSVEQSRMNYHWGTGNRLHAIENELTGNHTRFDYDAFDNLIKAEYDEGKQKIETIYRSPDPIGNLYETENRSDRKYGKGGRLLEDLNYHYHYDPEGYLLFKEFKKQQGYSSLGREAIEKKYGIKFKATATGWLYEWSSAGMLRKVVNPWQGKIRFGYDALGRRTYKEVKDVRTHWLWDGNVPLHEWQSIRKKPETDTLDIITWVFEEGSFVPCARLTSGKSESIVTDYLGTPTRMYDTNGNKTWEAGLDIFGRVRTFEGRSLKDCPFRYQGQYQDEETGLYYNRFRYYDPEIGSYISQDPIGLDSDTLNLYGYVNDINYGIDPLGLYNPYGHKTNGQFKKKPGRKPNTRPSVHGNSRTSTKPAVLYAQYDGDGNFQKWGITDKVDNPRARYGNTIPDDWEVVEMTRGSRTDMLDLERELSEKAPGKLNNESWAGSKQGQPLSSEAEGINNKMKKHNH